MATAMFVKREEGMEWDRKDGLSTITHGWFTYGRMCRSAKNLQSIHFEEWKEREIHGFIDYYWIAYEG